MKSSRKRSYEQLQKPVTFDELHQLRELENSFNDNLFKLQLAELMDEYILKPSEKQKYDALLKELREHLKSLPSIDRTEVIEYMERIKDSHIKVPFQNYNNNLRNVHIQLSTPPECWLVGSYHLGTVLKPKIVADVILILPDNFYESKDEKNYIYHLKRSLFLQHLATFLSKYNKICKMEYESIEDDSLPILKVTFASNRNFAIKLIPVLPKNAISISSLDLTSSNVDPSRMTYYKILKTLEFNVQERIPSTLYNQALLYETIYKDLLQDFYIKLSANHYSQQTLCICKLWLKNIDLYQKRGTVDGTLLLSIWSFLVSLNQITTSTPPILAFRHFLKFITTENWEDQNLSHRLESSSNVMGKDLDPKTANFHKFFPIVLLDPTGCVNLARNLTLHSYHLLKYEAAKALKILNDSPPEMDIFSTLFLRPREFYLTYDQFLCLQISSYRSLKENRPRDFANSIVDRRAEFIVSTISFIYTTLKRALGCRTRSIGIIPHQYASWDVSVDYQEAQKPLQESRQKIWIGFSLQPEMYYDPEVKGPPANDPKAIEFRNFWKGLSEIIKYPDSSILEVVRFSPSSSDSVFSLILKHIIFSYQIVDQSGFYLISNQLDFAIKAPIQSTYYSDDGDYGEIKQSQLNFLGSFNSFTKLLKSLKRQFPLTIRSVQPSCSQFSLTAVDDVKPIFICTNKKTTLHMVQSCVYDKEQPEKTASLPGNLKLMMPSSNISTVFQSPSIQFVNHVVLEFMETNKWRNDYQAIKHTKVSLAITLASILRNRWGLNTAVSIDFFDVYYMGFVFRVEIYVPRELQHLLEKSKSESKKKNVFQENFNDLYQRLYIKPLHCRHIKTFGLKHPSYFNCCRVIKRWISSQMLYYHIPDEVVELLTVLSYNNFFLSHGHFPSHHLQGFFQFLFMLYEMSFSEPLVLYVHFSEDRLQNTITEDTQNESENKNAKKKHTKFPGNNHPLRLITVYDSEGLHWTRKRPSVVILKRLKLLSFAALTVTKNDVFSELNFSNLNPFMSLFAHDISDYDVVLKLKTPNSSNNESSKVSSTTLPASFFPPVQFEPLDQFFKTLINNYSHVAMIFFDCHYRRDHIGLVWIQKSISGSKIYKPFDDFAVISEMVKSAPSHKTVGFRGYNIKFCPKTILSEIQILGGELITEIITR